MKRILNNLSLAMGCTFAFIIPEQIYRYMNDILELNISAKLVLEYFAIMLIISFFVNKKTILIVLSIFSLFSWLQYVHFSYYGTFIFPHEYYLFFMEIKETFYTFTTVLHVVILPTILVGLSISLIYLFINNLNENRAKSKIASIIFAIIILYIPASAFKKYTEGERAKGSRPNFEHSTVKNTLLTQGYLLGNLTPRLLSGNSGLELDNIETPNIITPPLANVVVIMGESINREFMSLYGYSLSTTPEINKIKDEESFIYKKAIAGGVLTDIAVPSFINMIKRPDGLKQIISQNTCLFKMAKDNGFKTYFYSSQAQESLKSINSYICMNSVDDYKNGTYITKDKSRSSLDLNLLEMIKDIEFNKNSNFIVLQQRAAHTPAKDTYPKEFEYFTQNDFPNFRKVDLEYFNAVRYIDFVNSEIIKEIKKKTTRPTYIIFTSDHATSVGDKNRNGHGSLSFDSIYKVPFFIYSINTKNKIKEKLSDFNYISHYQISNIVSSLLGYETQYDNGYFNKKETFFVNGANISGLAGYLKIDFNDNGEKIQSLEE